MSEWEEEATMTLTGSLEEQADALERDATAVRKLSEAARDLGEERVLALLAPILNGNRNGNANVSEHNGAVVEPEPEPELEPDGPRGREAVRRIVRERPGVWSLADLRGEMKRRGWFASNKAVDVAVTRLVGSNEARRVGTGRYEFFVADDPRLL